MSTISTIGTASRNYSTIAAWLTAFSSGGWIGECYADSEFTSTANFSGHATSSSNFIILRAAAGQAAVDNSANPLRYDATKGAALKSTVQYAKALYINESFVTIERMQVLKTVNGSCIYADVSLSSILVDRCILYYQGTRFSTTVPIVVHNNVIIRNSLVISDNSYGICFNPSTAGNASKAINCTIVAPSDKANGAFSIFTSPSMDTSTVVENCALFGFSGYDNDFATVNTYNASDNSNLSTAGTHNINSLVYANQFNGVTTASLDFRIKAGSSLIGAAVTDTTNIPGAIDIFGTART